MKSFYFFLVLIAAAFISNAQDKDSKPNNSQIMTAAQKLVANTGEDLLSGNNGEIAQTVLSGYGQASFQRDNKYKNNHINLDRVVLFVGHQFSKRIALFTELEVEDAKVEGGEFHGSVGMEQAYLKFSLNTRSYFVAGLFLPRIGILNENHLPINFNGVERPLVEQFIIPSTWRELGVGFYSQLSTLPISYSLALVNGLNAGSFKHGSGIKGGKSEGQMASANNIAFMAAVNAYVDNFKFQVSGYVGGTVPLTKYQADSLNSISGLFAAPLYLGEADVQYDLGGFSAKILGTYGAYPQAQEVNSLYANNTPSSFYGAYAEVGFDFLEHLNNPMFDDKKLIGFARFEKLNINAQIPTNGIIDGTLDQRHFLLGLSYLPTNNVVIKADVRMTHTGPQNNGLLINPPPVMLPYQQNNSFINVGIGYSF